MATWPLGPPRETPGELTPARERSQRVRNRNRTPGAAAARLLPVAAAVAVVSRLLSARGPRHFSARDPRRLSARGQNYLSAWSECTAHRVCARSDGLLQRTQ